MSVAPIEIIDAFESILDIFLSDIRHRERASFILCDNLVEMACKTKHVQYCRRNGSAPNARCNFHEALVLPGIRRLSQEFRERLQGRRDVRNLMQHESASVAVDTQTAADAIKDIPVLLDRIWGDDAINNLRPWQLVAMRIVRLYSSEGNANIRQLFEDQMRAEQWRGNAEERPPRINETIIECGLRNHWAIAVKQNPHQVEQILNNLSVE